MVLKKISGVTGVNSLELATPTELTFWNGKDIRKLYITNSRRIIIREKDMTPKLANDFPYGRFILVNNPRLEFIKYAWEYHPPLYMWGRVITGDNVLVGDNCSIGKDGLGYERDEDGKLWKFPHYGGVKIGNNIDIGSNTCIDRGAFGNTEIGDGTKIDNLVHIAHNVKIGKNCLIVAGTVIGGGAIIEDNVWLGINSSIREGIIVGDGALVGMGAVVVKDVEPHTTVIGNPARVYEK